jgi:hypothetical protein
MTVSELIEELRKYPGDMLVMYNYDDGYNYSAPELEIQTVFRKGESENYESSCYSKSGDGIEVLAIY